MLSSRQYYFCLTHHPIPTHNAHFTKTLDLSSPLHTVHSVPSHCLRIKCKFLNKTLPSLASASLALVFRPSGTSVISRMCPTLWPLGPHIAIPPPARLFPLLFPWVVPTLSSCLSSAVTSSGLARYPGSSQASSYEPAEPCAFPGVALTVPHRDCTPF